MRKAWALAIALMLILTVIGAALILSLPKGGDGPNEEEVVPDPDRLSVHFIDVGQGDATLIMVPGGERILIDAGPLGSEGIVLDYLDSMHVTHLDALVVSHSDSDHCGGADDVLSALPVDLVVHSGFYKDTPAYHDFLEAVQAEGCPVLTRESIEEGQYLDLADNLTARVLSAYRQADESNEASIVLQLTYGSEDFLFMGDAPSGVEDWCMRQYDIDAEVLKVAHHGSYSSTSSAFLDEVTPDYAIIFCGKDNDYGYPHDEVLGRLTGCGATVLRTDLSGTVVLESDGVSLERST